MTATSWPLSSVTLIVPGSRISMAPNVAPSSRASRRMAACGFSATVADGHDFVKQHVDYVSTKGGGRGAVREVCEYILAAQGKLEAAFAPFLPGAAA